MSWTECIARIKAGANDEYLLYVTGGVVIDGYGVGHSGAMANHHCNPNAELEHAILPGRERAPIGLLRAKEKIFRGNEIRVKYGYFDCSVDPMPNLSDVNAYVPCLCGSECCVKVFRVKRV